jgi:hypothetical protein
VPFIDLTEKVGLEVVVVYYRPSEPADLCNSIVSLPTNFSARVIGIIGLFFRFLILELIFGILIVGLWSRVILNRVPV